MVGSKGLIVAGARMFKDIKILVIGDVMLDKYIWGEVSRISPEAPVPIILKDGQRQVLGGASNVVNNIYGLGAIPIVCGVVGADPNAGHIISMLDQMELPIGGIIIDKDRPTTVKGRVIGNNQQIVRIDEESSKPINSNIMNMVLAFVESSLSEIDAIIISDYGKGIISRKLIYELRDMAKDKIITVDPKVGNFRFYKGVTCITPNHHEAGEFCGFKIVNKRTLDRAGKQIIEKLECESVLITQGKDGMTLFEASGNVVHLPARVKRVFDVSGAGDTVISVFTTALAAGTGMKEAAAIANVAAGIVVAEPGTSVIVIDKLAKELN
jgi:D-beta-D-heptose 7-phosphate kinase/D-beta-D-heptose 1-phosphate adenosyltransferase